MVQGGMTTVWIVGDKDILSLIQALRLGVYLKNRQRSIQESRKYAIETGGDLRSRSATFARQKRHQARKKGREYTRLSVDTGLFREGERRASAKKLELRIFPAEIYAVSIEVVDGLHDT